MTKTETRRIVAALKAGTIPCCMCRKEQPPDRLEKGRCKNRNACLRRGIMYAPRPAKFVTLPKGPGKIRRSRVVFDPQKAAYDEDRLALFHEKRPPDLAVA